MITLMAHSVKLQALSRSPGMHRCLQIPEIFKTILEEVSERQKYFEWLFPVERSTYASMAQTCRAFYEPSMDCLWATLPTLEPLANCMPPIVLNACVSDDPNVDITVSAVWVVVLNSC